MKLGVKNTGNDTTRRFLTAYLSLGPRRLRSGGRGEPDPVAVGLPRREADRVRRRRRPRLYPLRVLQRALLEVLLPLRLYQHGRHHEHALQDVPPR